MTIGLPLMTAFLFMSFGFTYYYENSINEMKDSNVYVNESSQLELATTGIQLAKEILYSNNEWSNCFNKEKDCGYKDSEGFYYLYSDTLNKEIKDYELNTGKINVLLKNLNDTEILVISEGIEGGYKKNISHIFKLTNNIDANFLPTIYTNTGILGTNGKISLCTDKLDLNGNILGQVNTNTSLYWGENSFNKYSVMSPNINIDSSIDRNVKLITNKEFFNICAPGGDEIYSTGNVKLTTSCSSSYSVDRIWANGDVSFMNGTESNEIKSNGDYVTYPDFRETFNDYIFNIDNYSGELDEEPISSFDFSNHFYYTNGFSNHLNLNYGEDNLLNLFTELIDLKNVNNLRSSDSDYLITNNSSLYFNNSTSQSVEVRSNTSSSCIYPTNPYNYWTMYLLHQSWKYGFEEANTKQDCNFLNNILQACRKGYDAKTNYESCLANNSFADVNYTGSLELFDGNDIININGHLGGKILVKSGKNQIDIDKHVYSSAIFDLGSGDDEIRIGLNLNKNIDLKNGKNKLQVGGDSLSIYSSLSGGENEVNINNNLNGNIIFEASENLIFVGSNLNGSINIKPKNNANNFIFIGNNISGKIEVFDSTISSNEDLTVEENVYNKINLGFGNDIIKLKRSTNLISLNGKIGDSKNINIETDINAIELLGNSNDNIYIGGNITGEMGLNRNSLYLGYGEDNVFIEGNVFNLEKLGGLNKIVIKGNLLGSINMGLNGNEDSKIIIKGTLGEWGGTTKFYNGNDQIYVGKMVNYHTINMGGGNDQVIINDRILNIIDGSTGIDSILLLSYSRADWDNNKDNIKNNIRNFENISFSSGANIVNGGTLEDSKNIICKDGDVLDLKSGIYNEIKIIGSCKLNLIGNEYYIENLYSDSGSFNREAEINYFENVDFNVLNIDITNGKIKLNQSIENSNFNLFSDTFNLNNSNFECNIPLSCLFKINKGTFSGNINSAGSFMFLDNFIYNGTMSNLYSHKGSFISEKMTINSNMNACNLYDPLINSINSNIDWNDLSFSGLGPIPTTPKETLKMICFDKEDCLNKINLIYE
jgi:hypothetical protein